MRIKESMDGEQGDDGGVHGTQGVHIVLIECR